MARALRDTEHETAQDVLDQQQSFSSAASFTVMTLNCRYGGADAKSIVGAVLARNVAVLALQEATDELVDALNSAGLGARAPRQPVRWATGSADGATCTMSGCCPVCWSGSIPRAITCPVLR